MTADDFFMGWGFMIALGPFYALISAILALPSAIFSHTGHKRAGFISWVLAMAAILAYGIFPIEHMEIQNLIPLLTFLTSFGFAPQGLAYLWTRERPAMRPLVAGGLGIGAALLYVLLGFLLGATPD